MWPWGHAAVGYLAYAGHERYHHDAAPTAGATVALALGTQFPDLVDKPLGWTLGVLPAGRSLAHSLFALALVAALVFAVARRRGRPDVAVAFGTGYLSHVLADGLYATVAGEFESLTYLAWPVLPAPEPTIAKSFLAHILALEFDAWFALEAVLVVLAVGLWTRDGWPGIGMVRRLRRDADARET